MTQQILLLKEEILHKDFLKENLMLRMTVVISIKNKIMKTAILLNEDFLEMRLGLNSTLAYILGAVDLGNDVYLVDVRDEGKITLLKKENCQNLINSYKKENQNLLNPEVSAEKFVKDIEFNLQKVDFDINDCDFLVQRLDPTHAPFPPKGKADYHEFLRDYFADKNIKNQNFNYPIDCYLDKELPVKMNLDIEVKSWISFVEDDLLIENILKAKDFSGNNKVVLKPDNSGQSMGVFAIEFVKNGDNLADFSQYGAENLKNMQIYHISKSCDLNELHKIILFLLFCQSSKFSKKYQGKKYQDLDEKEIKNLKSRIDKVSGYKGMVGKNSKIQIIGVRLNYTKLLRKLSSKLIEWFGFAHHDSAIYVLS